ncbi:MAG TPA: DegV family protein [Acidimicrobiales bacterium]|nr:DegV family protein [Acidimicrobiales bacterium]
MPVAVVTDSAAALPEELASKLGVEVVPMQLEIGGRPVSEAEVTLEELVARLDDGVRTSGPAPGRFAEAIERADTGDGVLVTTVAERLSSTYQSAMTAVRSLGPSRRVRVVDTGTAAGAEGLVVVAAAQLASDGASLDQVAGEAERVSGRVRLVAAVEDLRYLIRGGRVPASAARAGTRLGVRVLFELRQARVRPLLPTFGSERALEQLLAHWRRSRPPDRRLHVASLHAMRPELAEELLDAVCREVEPATSFCATFGPVMVAHTGAGIIGLAWWWE